MKKFAFVLVQLKTLALEKIEQKLESKRLELRQNEPRNFGQTSPIECV